MTGASELASRIHVASRRRSRARLEAQWPGARIIDLSSKAELPWRRFSPFYPHGGIPVPFSPGRHAQSVEGIWQALKVFESADVDPGKLDNATMKGLKRTVRRFGRCLGHRRGIDGDELLGYVDARKRIYLPAHRHVLEHDLAHELDQLRTWLAEPEGSLVFLDYETNLDIEETARPLSHAGLVRAWLLEDWPSERSTPRSVSPKFG